MARPITTDEELIDKICGYSDEQFRRFVVENLIGARQVTDLVKTRSRRNFILLSLILLLLAFGAVLGVIILVMLYNGL